MIGEVLYNAQDAQTWLLDSGATFHVTSNGSWTILNAPTTNDIVGLGNEQECAIVGIKEVPIQADGNTITLQQVQHVPELKRSLVSIYMLANDGYQTTFSESPWIISRGNLMIRNGYYESAFGIQAIEH